MKCKISGCPNTSVQSPRHFLLSFCDVNSCKCHAPPLSPSFNILCFENKKRLSVVIVAEGKQDRFDPGYSHCAIGLGDLASANQFLLSD